jgi:cyclopropane fatty-acyl-phospholipid synthase-like methyltransferase
MNPNDPPDYKTLVRQGYDACAASYEAARRSESAPELALLLPHLARRATVLDVGCGAGVPVAKVLARNYWVTGVDISAEQVRRARRNVPSGAFLVSDIMGVDFPPASFDAVVSFYTIFHLPRAEHPELFHRIRRWLKPGGHFLGTLSAQAEENTLDDDFFGTQMYWSNFGLDEYRAILEKAGFELLEVQTLGHGYRDDAAPEESHPLVLARST